MKTVTVTTREPQMTSEASPEEKAEFTRQLIDVFGIDETRRMAGHRFPSTEGLIDIAMLRRPTEKCRHCGRPIATLGGKWTHTDHDGLPLIFGRGCRSASWESRSEEDGYDPSLDKRLKAAALPGVRRPKES